ncbi:alpha/beta hydrolase [Streptomyces sp900105755]|uniref:alpha/beta fold hydrolase n=1 Tax=Streptomyces sp. 900105755 TaxID=3154389 RepID=UPI0033208624
MKVSRTAVLAGTVTMAAVVGVTALALPQGGGPAPATPSVQAPVPAGFTEHKVTVNNVGIDYVEGGKGPTLVLLHGYPETWYDWHKVMPALAEHYRVVAPSIRGAGKSDAPASGYDKKTMAADIHALMQRIGGGEHIYLVGHDIGTMVAYAYAAAHPSEVRKLVLSEAPLPDPSLYTFPSLTAKGPGAWNFGYFNLTNGLPENMIEGKEPTWVQGFTDSLKYNKNGVTAQDAQIYGTYLKDPAHLSASFKWFRTFNQDVADNAVYAKTKLKMPVLAIGAQYSLGTVVRDQVKKYGTNVTGAVIPNSGHWIWEERPDYMTNLLENFLNKP